MIIEQYLKHLKKTNRIYNKTKTILLTCCPQPFLIECESQYVLGFFCNLILHAAQAYYEQFCDNTEDFHAIALDMIATGEDNGQSKDIQGVREGMAWWSGLYSEVLSHCFSGSCCICIKLYTNLSAYLLEVFCICVEHAGDCCGFQSGRLTVSVEVTVSVVL